MHASSHCWFDFCSRFFLFFSLLRLRFASLFLFLFALIPPRTALDFQFSAPPPSSARPAACWLMRAAHIRVRGKEDHNNETMKIGKKEN
jgi:hypothetical protein